MTIPFSCRSQGTHGQKRNVGLREEQARVIARVTYLLDHDHGGRPAAIAINRRLHSKLLVHCLEGLQERVLQGQESVWVRTATVFPLETHSQRQRVPDLLGHQMAVRAVAIKDTAEGRALVGAEILRESL